MAAALPFLTVAATVIGGVMAFQQQRAAADMQAAQADMMIRASQQRAAAISIQTEMQALENDALDLQLMDDANQRRRRFYQMQQEATGQAAARGFVAAPIGSFGAILGDAEDELYRDLESNALEREYLKTKAVTEYALGKQAQWSALETGRYGAALADFQSDITKFGSYGTLFNTVIKGAQIWTDFSAAKAEAS